MVWASYLLDGRLRVCESQIGRYITQSKDPERAVREFLESTRDMVRDIDLQRVHVE